MSPSMIFLMMIDGFECPQIENRAETRTLVSMTASSRILSNASIAFFLLSSSDNALISNGILRSLTIVFIKMVRAAVLLSPNSSQSLSKSFFNESSTLNVIAVCAIIHILYIASIIFVDRFLDSLRSLEMTEGTFARNDRGDVRSK